MKRILGLGFTLALLSGAFIASAPIWRAEAADCAKTSVGFVPLTDLGAGLYQGKQGGLYPGGSNVRPATHESAGLARAVQPLSAQGQPSADGKIVLVSIGLSNTTQEFSTFKPLADKEADANPKAAFPTHALTLKDEYAMIAQILKTRFPNIRLAYYSSRTYAGYASTTLNPEPFAYESGFAVKWLIEDQLNGSPDLNFDPARGTVRAPWLAWGPYLWADGMRPRGDGLTYACSDFAADGTHPAVGGARQKVAQMLLNFFKNDSTARLWFLSPAVIGDPLANVSAASFSGPTLATEEIVTAFGSNLATATLAAASTPLPTSLAGTTVKVRDSAGAERLAPLFFVSPTQVNYQIPAGTVTGTATITITSSDGSLSSGAAQVVTVAPGLFAANASGQGVAAALALRIKADGTQQFEPVGQFDAARNQFIAKPIDLGPETDRVFLILFGTGLRFRSSLAAVTARIGGLDAQVLFAGPQSDFVGLDQVNVRLPRSLAGRGDVEVALTVDG